MLYDMVNDCMQSLANQWRDLGEAFSRLAGTFGAGAAQISLEALAATCDNDPSDTKNGNPNLAYGFRQRLQSLLSNGGLSAFRRAAQLMPFAIRELDQAEHQLNAVNSRFTAILDLGDTTEVLVCREQLSSMGEFIANMLQEFEELTSVQGERANIKGIRGAAEDIAAYPILTSDMGAITPRAAPQPAAGGPLPLQRVIESAMREVIGRVPKANDTRSFVAALNQSFSIVEVEGRSEISWTPRSYAGQTELGGGVTGAQASLYSRARVAQSNALPLLDMLHPLLPDADQELITAARAIVRSDVVELVEELGTEGGPRVARVEGLFELLLQSETTDEKGKPVKGGHLGYLQHVLGLYRERVNTLDEETNVTNFIALQDYITSLQQSWGAFNKQWLGKDLGTRLVLLSRALSVTAEAVDEVYAAMDSVFVGPAERQVATFRDDKGRGILVEELLSWVVDFASTEAPNLVHTGGRRGAAAIVGTAQKLEDLAQRFIQAIPYEPELPEGLRHPRVAKPLRELCSYLIRVQRLAQDINRP